MSLADLLQEAKTPMRGLPCPIATVIAQLDERDRVQLLDTLELPAGTTGHLPTTVIARALGEAGFPVHYKGVERHRNQMCRCFTGSGL